MFSVYIRTENRLLRHGIPVNPDPGYKQVLSFIVIPVTDNIPVFINDDNAAFLPHMTVTGHFDYEMIYIPLKTFSVVGHLYKAALLQFYRSVFPQQ